MQRVAGSGPFHLGVMLGPHDPSAAIVRDGRVLALADEERFTRTKHAFGAYPFHAIEYCLASVGATWAEVESIATHWDIAAHADGRIAAHYRRIGERWDVDPATIAWQRRQLDAWSPDGLLATHARALHRRFGVAPPPIVGFPHHRTHAFQAAHASPFDEAVVLVLDGSGDTHSGSLWHHADGDLTMLHEVQLPHSLGWFFAAITEYLGFDASDGEYKVMGMAAYGDVDADLLAAMSEIVMEAEDGIGYVLDPTFIHFGEHTYSGRFTDRLVERLGRPPRSASEPIERWHLDVAAVAQHLLEAAACRLITWAVHATGTRRVVVSGGVAMNVKMNAAIARLDEVDDVFADPACADDGAAAGAALAECRAHCGHDPQPLASMALGPAFDDDAVAAVLAEVGVPSHRPDDIAAETARLLADGMIVGWFHGRMEAGARALGHRSILADPRDATTQDRVNAAIKFREPWRPFAPSMLAADRSRYLVGAGDGRFMMQGFDATEALRAAAPAVVHTDGTTRAHLVDDTANPRYAALLRAFGERTGVPVLLNTSFNLAGEPIVCSPRDALRTFFSSGIDVLVLEGHLIVKERRPGGGRSSRRRQPNEAVDTLRR